VKLVYWCCAHLTDSHAYSIRARTRREAMARRAAQPEDFGQPTKVTVTYRDAFDLIDQALGEGGIGEPNE